MTIGGKGRGSGRNKPKRGGGKHFTPARVLRQEDANVKPISLNEESNSGGSESDKDDIEPVPSNLSIFNNANLGNTLNESSSTEDFKDLVNNPNHSSNTFLKPSEIGGERELSRRERENMAKEKAKAAFWKAQMEGKTDQARADLARLTIIKKQREEAAKRKAEELANKNKISASKVDSLNAGGSRINQSLGKKK